MGREPGFRLEPRLPVRPPRGRKQGQGRPAQVFLPPPPDRPVTGVSAERWAGERHGERERGETEKAPFPLNLGTSECWCLVCFSCEFEFRLLCVCVSLQALWL